MSAPSPIHGHPQPRLEGHGLCLSAFGLADVPAILEGDRDPETARRLGWAPHDSSAEKVRAHVAICERRWTEGDRAAGAVRLANRPAALGHVELNIIDRGRAKISYSTYPPARGRGLAARAVDLACVFAFEQLGLARVQLLTDADNLASHKVAAKAGFTAEGLLRDFGERGGRRHDMVLYSRLRSDPRPTFRCAADLGGEFIHSPRQDRSIGCDLGLVHRALRLLSASGADCWVFGGWAEELRGLCPARPHEDLDLLCVAPSFAAVERLLGGGRVDEIEGKRLPHKRAFVLDGVMVELFLVERDRRGLFTNFWARCRHDWPIDVMGSACDLPVASAAALTGYRRAHSTLHRS